MKSVWEGQYQHAQAQHWQTMLRLSAGILSVGHGPPHANEAKGSRHTGLPRTAWGQY